VKLLEAREGALIKKPLETFGAFGGFIFALSLSIQPQQGHHLSTPSSYNCCSTTSLNLSIVYAKRK